MNAKNIIRVRYVVPAVLLIVLIAAFNIYFRIQARQPVVVKDVNVTLEPAVDIGDGVLLRGITALFEGQIYEVKPLGDHYRIPVKFDIDNPGEVQKTVMIAIRYSPGRSHYYEPVEGDQGVSIPLNVESGYQGYLEVPVSFSHPADGAYLDINIAAEGGVSFGGPIDNPHQHRSIIELDVEYAR